MKNYLKIFRVRSMIPEIEGGPLSSPHEEFVFFDDEDVAETLRAITSAEHARTRLGGEFVTRIAVCFDTYAHSPVKTYPAIGDASC